MEAKNSPTTDHPLLKGLNDAQKEAVLATEGPVLILAGAGSGKTKCLTHRLAYILETKRAQKDEILAVTFTNKASQEMGGRILKLMGQSIEHWQRAPGLVMRRHLPWVGTFHSICVRLLRNEHEAIGLTKSFTIFDHDDTKSLIRSILKELNLDTKQFSPQAVSATISGAKNELMSPEDYAKFAQGYFQKICLDVYRKYQTRLRELSALDFDDLIMATVKMLEQFPQIRKKYHQQFKYVMIDEYQDTNHAQYRLSALLVDQETKNICVVGDDTQAIYGWRGANFRNILNFNKDYPTARIYKLEQNYRSTKTVIAGASQVANHIRQRSDKKLWTENEQGPPITVFEANNQYGEAEFICTEIKMLQALGYQLNDFAVLYRINAQSRTFEEVLLSQGIPYRLVGALRFYERKEIKDLLAYLRFIVNPNDVHSFARMVNVPPRGIGPKTIEKGSPKIDQFLIKIDALRIKVTSIAPSQMVQEIINTFNFQPFVDDGTPEGIGRWENVEELVNLASEFDSIDDFLEHVALISDIDNFDQNAEAVTLMTLHSSKGLEFTNVFLAGMEEGLLPHMRSLEDEHEMDEERRLCYVGMTRAKKRLYLTMAKTRILHGGLTVTLPSRFVEEIDESLIDRV